MDIKHHGLTKASARRERRDAAGPRLTRRERAANPSPPRPLAADGVHDPEAGPADRPGAGVPDGLQHPHPGARGPQVRAPRGAGARALGVDSARHGGASPAQADADGGRDADGPGGGLEGVGVGGVPARGPRAAGTGSFCHGGASALAGRSQVALFEQRRLRGCGPSAPPLNATWRPVSPASRHFASHSSPGCRSRVAPAVTLGSPRVRAWGTTSKILVDPPLRSRARGPPRLTLKSARGVRRASIGAARAPGTA